MTERDDFKGKNIPDLSDEEIESSTVFSKPADPISNPRKPKKEWLIAVIMACVLASVIGAIAIANSIPDSEGVTASSEEVSSEEVITAVSVPQSEIAEIHLKNSFCDVTAYPETVVATTASSDASSSGEETVWYLKDKEKTYVDTENVLALAESISEILAMKRVTGQNVDFGFEKPLAVVDVKCSDQTKNYTVTIGGATAIADGYYLKVSSSDDIYVVSNDTAMFFNCELSYFTEKALPSVILKDETNEAYFDISSGLKFFDYITVSGSIVPEKYRFETQNYENCLINYIMTEPHRYNVNEEAISEVLSPVTETIEASDIYSFDRTASSLSKYGLKTPSATVVYKVGERKVTFDLGVTEDQNFFAVTVDDHPFIYKVARHNFTFVGKTKVEFLSNNLFLDNIAGVGKIKFQTPDYNYEFELFSETATDEEGNETTENFVKCGGENVSYENFTNIYAHLLNACPIEFQTELSSGRNILTVSISYKEKGRENTVLSFTEYSDRRYQATVNGSVVGVLPPNDIDNIVGYVKALINGQEVPSIS